MEPINYLYRELIFTLISAVDGDNLDEDERAFAVELKTKSATLTDPLNFNEKECEDLYKSILTSALSDYLTDVKASVREGKVRTGLVAEPGNYAESEAVGIPVSGTADIYIGWTYFFGGGKHAEPEAIEWIKNCYLVKSQDRVQTVKVFAKFIPREEVDI